MARLSDSEIIDFNERKNYKEKSEEKIRNYFAKTNGVALPTEIIQATPDWRLSLFNLTMYGSCIPDKCVYVELLNQFWNVRICMKVDSEEKIEQAANTIAYILAEIKNMEDAKCIENIYCLK